MKFDLSDSLHALSPIEGYATEEGTQRYAQRNAALIDASNFGDVNGLTLSRLIAGTAQGSHTPGVDFDLYCAVRWAVLSGGCNHLDTGHVFRCHRSEYVVGLVLRTLVEKFGVQRDEVFINSKQGFLDYDAFNQEKTSLQIEELIQSSGLSISPSDFHDHGMMKYSMHPISLKNSLKKSLAKMNISTLDCAFLDEPHETIRRFMDDKAQFNAQLTRAFEFYEGAVSDGLIRSYGVSVNESARFSLDF